MGELNKPKFEISWQKTKYQPIADIALICENNKYPYQFGKYRGIHLLQISKSRYSHLTQRSIPLTPGSRLSGSGIF